MADQNRTGELFDLWSKQIRAGTEAWAQQVERMAEQGAPAAAAPDPTAAWRPFIDQHLAAWAQLQGAGPVNPYILALWKKFLDDWVAAWSEALERAMGTEAFAEMMGKTLDQFLNTQQSAKQATTKASKATLESLGLPSRDQIVGLARQLMDLEDRLEGLEDRLEALAGGVTPKRAARQAGGAAKKKAKKKTGASRKKSGGKRKT